MRLELHWLPLVSALALLWMPRAWMRAGPRLVRRKKGQRLAHSWTHAPQDGTVLSFGHEFTKVRNYLDAGRALVGMWLLLGSSLLPPAFTVGAPAVPGAARQVLGAQAGVLLVGLLIQCVRFEGRGLALAAPVFYLAGILCGLQVPLAGLAAFAVAWALVPVVPFTPGFLTVMGLVFAVVGVFLGGLSPLILFGASLCLAPVVLSLLSRRPLMVFSRRSTRSR